MFCIAAAVASSCTTNVAEPPAGTFSDVPPGNEYATPGIDERASYESVYDCADPPWFSTRIVRCAEYVPATSTSPNETLTEPEPSAL